MNAEELKGKLREIFGEQVLFNKLFDEYANSIKSIDAYLIDWCFQIKDKKIQPVPSSISDYIIFIKKVGSSNRCIVLKVKNGEVKEIHLGNHEYYDKLRKQLGLKQSS